jgi:hypothetical protein
MKQSGEDKPAFRLRTAEVVTAAGFLAIGAIVIMDSLRLGTGWKDDGPQSGYFPFYIGAIICVASVVNLAAALIQAAKRNPAFVERGQLKLVLSVLVPTAVYVGLIGGLGIYVASALFVALFMRWLGEYAWWKVAAVSVGNSAVFFLIFELWFKIPLPKGPLEAALGLN